MLWTILKPFVIQAVTAILPLVLKKLTEQQTSTPAGTLSLTSHQHEIDLHKAIKEAVDEYSA